MIKTNSISMTVEKNRHEFYCDKCNEYLGDAIELEDGYVPPIAEFEHSICINTKWYKKKNTCCNRCRGEFQNELIETIKQLGYVEDNE